MTNTTKLRIDLNQGTLDVEGNEDFVREIYQEFKSRVESNNFRNGSPRKKIKGSPSNKAKGAANKFQEIQNLNLEPAAGPSLKERYRTFKKLSRNEKFLLYIAYLSEERGIQKVTSDHIYTCMRAVEGHVPDTLKQILSNSKNKTGWFTNRDGKLELTQRGKAYYQKELINKKKEKQ